LEEIMGVGGGTDITKSEERSDAKNTIQFKKRSLFEMIIEDHGIPGIIAVMVIGTICYIAIKQTMSGLDIELPGYLTEISTLIVGYYFGRQTGKNKN
jgi:hypothetical protein